MHSIELILYGICFFAIVSGLILITLALKYKTDVSPSFPVWNPKRWSHWKEWYTERGVRYSQIGGSLLAFAGLLYLITSLILYPR